MPNPFRDPPSLAPRFKHDPAACNAGCLSANAAAAATAMVGNNWRGVPWASAVGYAENSVGIRVGEGFWATVTAVDPAPLVIADPSTGKAVWIGRIEEHGQPAWAAFTVSAAGTRIGGIDALIRRKEYGAPYAEPAGVPSFAVLPQAQRTTRAAMLAAVDGFYGEYNAHRGKVPAALGASCRWTVNGQALGACTARFAANSLQWIARWRDRRLLAVDEARGLVAVTGFEDIPSVPREFKRADGSALRNPAGYPHSIQIVEVFRFVGGKVEQIERVSTEVPYGMKPH
jgi:hypothetical protein